MKIHFLAVVYFLTVEEVSFMAFSLIAKFFPVSGTIKLEIDLKVRCFLC